MSESSSLIIVAIDGPSGVGKTTTSRLVAESLGVPHIDTGAMYRAVALRLLEAGVSPDDSVRAPDVAAAMRIEFLRSNGAVRILADGRDVSADIRRPEVSMAASTVSSIPDVRRILVEQQRRIGRERGGVLEGRDIGTKVFPDTPHKFFLTASPEVRAERRFLELSVRGEAVTREGVWDEMQERDRQDSTRSDSPLTYDSTYELIDTSEMTIDEVVDAIVGRVLQVRDERRETGDSP